MWYHTLSMGRTLEIPDVPDALYAALEARAAGMALPAYLRDRLEQEAKPTIAEHAERMARKPPVDVSEPSASVIRRVRDGEE